MKQTRYEVSCHNWQTKIFYDLNIHNAIIQGYEFCRKFGLKLIALIRDEDGNVW